jgi:hypothetical protein
MELAASSRPFLYFPLQHHFSQNCRGGFVDLLLCPETGPDLPVCLTAVDRH